MICIFTSKVNFTLNSLLNIPLQEKLGVNTQIKSFIYLQYFSWNISVNLKIILPKKASRVESLSAIYTYASRS